MKKHRTEIVIIRGCKFRATKKQARKLMEEERKIAQKEWAANSLID